MPASRRGRDGPRCEKETPAIKGDAVISNGRLSRRGPPQRGHRALRHARRKVGPGAKVALLAADGDSVTKIDQLALVEAAKGAIALEVAGQTTKGVSVSVKLRLKKGNPALETVPGKGAARLRVEAPTRYVVFPDFFADDIVVDASKIPSASIEVPGENFLLHLTGKRDSIVMAVFENREQDVRLSLAGQGDGLRFHGL